MGGPAKRTISVTLDAELVEALEARGGDISLRLNKAAWDDLYREPRGQSLDAMLDRLDRELGPRTPEHEVEVLRFMRLLGGTPDDLAGSTTP